MYRCTKTYRILLQPTQSSVLLFYLDALVVDPTPEPEKVVLPEIVDLMDLEDSTEAACKTKKPNVAKETAAKETYAEKANANETGAKETGAEKTAAKQTDAKETGAKKVNANETLWGASNARKKLWQAQTILRVEQIFLVCGRS